MDDEEVDMKRRRGSDMVELLCRIKAHHGSVANLALATGRGRRGLGGDYRRYCP